jgi:hypothetical protein
MAENQHDEDGPWHNIKIVDGLALVATTSGPKDSYYALDTGSTTNVLDKETIAKACTKSFDITEYLPKPDAPYDVSEFWIWVCPEINLDDISRKLNTKIVGILGKAYFDRRIIEIDYEHDRMRQLSRRTLDGGGFGHKLSLVDRDGHCFFSPTVNGKKFDGLLIDTGSTGFMTVDEPHSGTFGLTSTEHKQISGTTVYGTFDGEGYFPKRVTVEGDAFERPLIGVFKGTKNLLGPNSLGSGFFSHYVVTIDGRRKAVYLQMVPNKAVENKWDGHP